MQTHSVIFSSYLLKENRRGRFQKRLIRMDGILLVCLSPQLVALPCKIMSFNPINHKDASLILPLYFIELLKKYYPTSPFPITQLMAPLIASSDQQLSEYCDFGIPDSNSRFFLMPKVLWTNLVDHPPLFHLPNQIHGPSTSKGSKQ